MSTSDQQEHGPLTRKQLREIRLTGSTPVITPQQAEAAAEASRAVPLPRAADPVEVPPAPRAADEEIASSTRLTRRQVREQERLKSASVGAEQAGAGEQAADDDRDDDASTAGDDAVVEVESVEPHDDAAVSAEEESPAEEKVEILEIDPAPSTVDDHHSAQVDSVTSPSVGSDTAGDDDDIDHVTEVAPAAEQDAARDGDAADGDAADGDAADVDAETERPTVNPAFGVGVLADAPDPRAPFRPSFDELLTAGGDSTGSQHSAPNALIFTPAAGDGSLSGPVASTGEILVTGSYELPRGMGSQGHAHGTTDGKDIDSVLIDGELPPSSSPTPIAASSAVSTLKPAGEVIRPPAPEKGNKLMLILAIAAGGLALALGVALVFAFTTNVI